MCVYVCLFVCWVVCLLGCLFVCWVVCLFFVCLFVYLFSLLILSLVINFPYVQMTFPQYFHRSAVCGISCKSTGQQYFETVHKEEGELARNCDTYRYTCTWNREEIVIIINTCLCQHSTHFYFCFCFPFHSIWKLRDCWKAASRKCNVTATKSSFSQDTLGDHKWCQTLVIQLTIFSGSNVLWSSSKLSAKQVALSNIVQEV